MFKPGDVAKVRSDGRSVTVVPGPTAAGKWSVTTDGGTFEEGELSQAHPSVLSTADGRDQSADFLKSMIREGGGEKLLEWELRKKLEKVLTKAVLDLNGHWKCGAAIRDGFNPLERLFLGHAGKADAEDLIRAAESGEPLDRWVTLDVGLSMSGLRACSSCGEENFATETNGTHIRIAGSPCEFPNGLPPAEWELNVPSGKIAVANDLRGLFPMEDDDFDIGTALGLRQTSLAYAAIGISHAFVGNSCPGVYQCGDGAFKIANPPQDQKWDGKKYVEIDPAPAFEGKKVASVCTDLWWYSVCDHDEFKKRCKRFKRKAGDFDAETVKVKPGVYRFRHSAERNDDGPEEHVYARFEWVRDPDPIKDLLAAYEEADVNANAYVQAQVAKWPTLYGRIKDRLGGKETPVPWSAMSERDRVHSWRRVADQAFFTIGGGVEWHEKGFPKAKVDPGVPDADPPAFREQYSWYPFSKPYGGIFTGAKLAPSFAKLAFRILESVISFGTAVRDDDRGRDVRWVRERMLTAVQRYRELAAQHPDLADPEYVGWLSQEGRAEAWVRDFPLGPEFTEKHKEHAARQRWVSEDAYAVAFDARKLKDGSFAGPNGWAHKKDAKRYAILEHGDNGQPPEANCFWSSHAVRTAVPLYSVARVVKVGEVSHMGETLVELAFDYGTPWMKDGSKRKAVPESVGKAGLKVLTKEEYEKALSEAIGLFQAEK